MTTYRLYPATNGPGSNASDNAQYTMGLLFKVTTSSQYLQGWWWWVASDQATNAEDFALWTVTGFHTGVYVASSKVTSGVFTAGQWNYVACAAPIALASGQAYMAVKSTNKAADGNVHYSATAFYFSSGSGKDGITNGPLLGYSSGNVNDLGSSNPDPDGEGQMMFNFGSGTDVTTLRPNDEFHATNYWLDVQVGPSATGSGALMAAIP